MVIPFLDVSKDKKNHNQTSNLESRRKNEQNSPKSATRKVFRDFSGNNKIYLANEVPILTSHLINQTVGTNPNLFIENTLLDATPPHTKEKYNRRNIKRRHVTNSMSLLQTDTMNTILVIPEKVQDQLRLFGILQIVNPPLYNEGTNH